jgi:predicted PurR-regulated permease PerM
VAIIHTADNILYPILIGPRIGLHPLILFIAFIGGAVAFGPAGLILGPAVVAFAFGLSEIWTRRRTSAPQEDRLREMIPITAEHEFAE